MNEFNKITIAVFVATNSLLPLFEVLKTLDSISDLKQNYAVNRKEILFSRTNKYECQLNIPVDLYMKLEFYSHPDKNKTEV